MRISRPCYDKMHRCPGWAGGGTRSAQVNHCVDGRLRGTRDGSLYAGRFWALRVNRCDACDVVVLPYAIRWIDPSWWLSCVRSLYRHHLRYLLRDARDLWRSRAR